MALTKLITSSRLEADFPNAYGRVVAVSIARKRGGGHAVQIDVAIYAKQPAGDDTQEVDFLRYHLALGDLRLGVGFNPVNLAYEYLKGLPEWSGAADV